jgi:hypothetical protein
VTYIYRKPPSFYSVQNVRHAFNPSVLNGFRVSQFPGYVFVAKAMRPQGGHNYNNVYKANDFCDTNITVPSSPPGQLSQTWLWLDDRGLILGRDKRLFYFFIAS